MKDSHGAESAPAKIYLDIVDDTNVYYTIPVAVADSYSAISGEPLVVPGAKGLLTNDLVSKDIAAVDTDLIVNNVTQPAHGTLSIDLFAFDDGGAFTYTPDEGYEGLDSFRYRAWDEWEGLVSDYGTVVVDVQAEPSPVLCRFYAGAISGWDGVLRSA